jgi:hypothetical protein
MAVSDHAPAQRPVRRWRSVFIALMLVLAIASTSETAPAQAQDGAEEYYYQVDVINPLDKTMCIDQTRDYHIRILVSGTIGPNDSIKDASLTLGAGTTITGEVSGSDVAEFTTARTVQVNSPDPGRIGPATAGFTLKAKREGRATITFSAKVVEFGHTFTARPFPPITVKVIPCNYKVSTSSLWLFRGKGGTAFASAFITGAKLPADQKDIADVTVNVVWVITEFIPGFGASVSITKGEAILAGNVIAGNQFALEMALLPVSGPEEICGPPGCGGGKVTLIPSYIEVTLPADGGTRQVHQQLEHPAGVLTGTATITLTLEPQKP